MNEPIVYHSLYNTSVCFNSAVFMPSMVRGLKFMPSLKGTDLVNDYVVFRKGLSKCIADPVVRMFIIPKSLHD